MSCSILRPSVPSSAGLALGGGIVVLLGVEVVLLYCKAAAVAYEAECVQQQSEDYQHANQPFAGSCVLLAHDICHGREQRGGHECQEEFIHGHGVTPLGVGIDVGHLFVEGLQASVANVQHDEDLDGEQQFAGHLTLGTGEQEHGQSHQRCGQEAQQGTYVGERMACEVGDVDVVERVDGQGAECPQAVGPVCQSAVEVEGVAEV